MYSIRPAQYTDAQNVAELIYSAYKEYAQQICGSLDLTTILERLKILFAHSKITIVHYSHYSILQEDSSQKIVGIVSCLRGDYIPIYYIQLAEVLAQISTTGEERVAQSIRDFVKTRVAYSNEYHLDVLAVAKEYRGLGFADILLAEATQRAKETELDYLTLLATDDLKDYYLNKGFEFHRKVLDLVSYNILYKKMSDAPNHYKDYHKS